MAIFVLRARQNFLLASQRNNGTPNESFIMPRKSPPKPDEKPQFERFLEAAEAIGAAKSDAGLAATIQKIAHARVPAAAPTRTHQR